MTIAIISHPDCLLHSAGAQHAECPERIVVIQNALKNYDFNVPIQFYECPSATQVQLLRAHDKRYLDWIYLVSPQDGMLAIDDDTRMNRYTLNAALRAAGSVPYAVELLMQGEACVAFCNVRPPGHHAEHNKAMGFCFFNNVAVGVMHAIEQYTFSRIAIIDFDVHHGNGTQDIFQNDERVLYCSSFQNPLYPCYIKSSDNKHILNLPLAEGTIGKTFCNKIANFWLKKIADFQPQLIFFSAGFDAHANDPLANLNLVKADYVWLTTQIANIAKPYCNGKMISVLEGGYNLDVLAQCVPAHVEAMVSI